MEYYRRLILIGIVCIALGINFSTTLQENTGSLGTVMIGLGSIFFIAGMSAKRKEDTKKDES